LTLPACRAARRATMALPRPPRKDPAMNRSRSPWALAALCLALIGGGLAATSALAEDLQLTGAQEVPPNDSKAVGTSAIRIDADGNVTGSVSTPTLQGRAAHIHTGARGVAGPPIITLTGGDPGTWTVPQGAKLTPAQLAAYKAGELYVNVHTAEHPGGEVRAQLIP
jgi:CHRD domain